MKKILSELHRPARRILIIGGLLTAAAVAASTLLYFGAGRLLDYYPCVDMSEKLLAASRPLGVLVCCGHSRLGIPLKAAGAQRRISSNSAPDCQTIFIMSNKPGRFFI